jgi:hypothetical protein
VPARATAPTIAEPAAPATGATVWTGRRPAVPAAPAAAQQAAAAPAAVARAARVPRWVLAVGGAGLFVGVVALGALAVLGNQVSNLALNRPVTASASLPDGPVEAAVDGISNVDRIWNSGADAPGWIRVDLGGPSTITGLRLTVAQYPAGDTRHRVLGRADEASEAILLHEFAGPTADKDVLEVTLDPPVGNIRFVTVETITSSSFVAWREIEVLGRR